MRGGRVGLAHQLGGEVTMDFAREGLCCRIAFDVAPPPEPSAEPDIEAAA